MTLNHALIEPAALHTMLSEDNLVILDASYGMGGVPPRLYWENARIGNAAFFDIDDIADRASSLPHMLPTPANFAAAVSALGIGNDTRVVIYDQTGIAMAAARAWWMFRIFGHDNVTVLNGGLPAWQHDGRPLTTTPPRPMSPNADFKATFRPELVRDKATVMTALPNNAVHIVDARAAVRFEGAAPEPRPGLRAGHMPGAVNLPFVSLLDPVTGRLLDRDALTAATAPLAAAPEIISTCGSGVTACVLALALHTLGRSDVAVYDGSWVEWGAEDAGTPVESNFLKV